MAQKKILFAVFCYNRPAVLENCLQSIADLCPEASVRIFDDNSSHPGMPGVFEKFGYPVENGPGGSGRHGGLYQNMQRAFEAAVDEGYDYFLTLQDDAQMVRPLSQEIIDEYQAVFDADENLVQIDPRFARLPGSQIEICNDVKAFEDVNPRFRHYVDMGFFHVARLHKLGWSFSVENLVVPGEVTKAAEAAKLGMRKVSAFTPVLMHVPFPDLYRNRIRLPRLSSFARKVFRFDYMSEEEMAEMDARPLAEPPLFRKYLRLSNLTRFDRFLLRGKDDSKIF